MALPYQYPGSPTIAINEVSVAYRKEVVLYLDVMRNTYTGRTLLDFISLSSHVILITPVIKPDRLMHSIENAYSDPISNEDAQQKGTMVNTSVDLGSDRGFITLPVGPFGTGKGSNTYIEYHPATWRQRMKVRHQVDPGAGPGEILFHEMVHAFRQMSGVFNDLTVTANFQMDNSEEFIAVLLTNLYRQERGFKAIRSNHHSFQAIPVPRTFQDVSVGPNGRRTSIAFEVNSDRNELIDPENYAEFYKVPIKQFFVSQPALFLAMAKSHVPHNPLAASARKMGIRL